MIRAAALLALACTAAAAAEPAPPRPSEPLSVRQGDRIAVPAGSPLRSRIQLAAVVM